MSKCVKWCSDSKDCDDLKVVKEDERFYKKAPEFQKAVHDRWEVADSKTRREIGREERAAALRCTRGTLSPKSLKNLPSDTFNGNTIFANESLGATNEIIDQF